ncbi:MAG: hypothetical protein WKG00_29510, partial [Polyangiaceae bacterium]
MLLLCGAAALSACIGDIGAGDEDNLLGGGTSNEPSGGSSSGGGVTPSGIQISATSQLPPRCTDTALRFPGLNLSDLRGSVADGYRENGVDVDLPRPGGARLSPDQ